MLQRITVVFEEKSSVNESSLVKTSKTHNESPLSTHLRKLLNISYIVLKKKVAAKLVMLHWLNTTLIKTRLIHFSDILSLFFSFDSKYTNSCSFF